MRQPYVIPYKMLAEHKKRKKINRRRTNQIHRRHARMNRTASEQIQLLDQRLGIGLGAVRERARLAPLVVI